MAVSDKYQKWIEPVVRCMKAAINWMIDQYWEYRRSIDIELYDR